MTHHSLVATLVKKALRSSPEGKPHRLNTFLANNHGEHMQVLLIQVDGKFPNLALMNWPLASVTRSHSYANKTQLFKVVFSK